MIDTNLDLNPAGLGATVGRRLKALRLQRNVTQAELARRAGVSRPTLVALEQGRSTLDTLARVAIALGREEGLAALFVPDPVIGVPAGPRPRQRARS
ncbi:MAG: helix-turn-helix transcriptional regulator [Deltaproteobacteria bacterium]|nr:helix-turn-helix transcriptional regulator [Deltaproteobacteria bacterium]